MKIEVWSDFVCPFCYIGKRRLEMALNEFSHKNQVDVEFRSFELDPSAPKYSDKGIYESLAAKFGSSVDQVMQMNKGIIQQAAEIGLTYNYDEMKPTNTFDAHRLAKYAKTLGKEAEITEKLLYSYFTDSKNVGDTATLVTIATEIGIDRVKVEEILKDEKAYAQDVRDDQRMAQQIGVTGVPYFVINQKYAISGAQPLETFKGALEKIWEEEKSKPKFEDISTDISDNTVCKDDTCAIPPKK